MTAELLEIEQTETPQDEDPLVHLLCGICYPDDELIDYAYCGHKFKSKTSLAWDGEQDRDICIVCADLSKTHYYEEHA